MPKRTESATELINYLGARNILEVARTCMISTQAVYSWLKGTSEPRPQTLRLLSLTYKKDEREIYSKIKDLSVE